MQTQPNGAQLSEITTFIDAGVVKPVVSTVLPLKEAAQAHELAGLGHARARSSSRLSPGRSITKGMKKAHDLTAEGENVWASTIISRFPSREEARTSSTEYCEAEQTLPTQEMNSGQETV